MQVNQGYLGLHSWIFKIYLLSIWPSIFLIFSFVSGWHKLSKRFRATSRRTIPTCGLPDLMCLFNLPVVPGAKTLPHLGWPSYKGIVRITPDPGGLDLSVYLPFRIGHPPLCIPWEEIEVLNTMRELPVILLLGKKEGVPLRISHKMARELGIESSKAVLQRPSPAIPS